jgi:dipeptidyl-peptidase 4
VEARPSAAINNPDHRWDMLMQRAGYDYRMIRQWTVGFEKVTWGGLDDRLSKVLDAKLREIEEVLPPSPLANLRSTVTIMADHTTPDFPAVAVYHWVGAEPWLREHGEPTCKAGSINILQSAEFISLVQDIARYPAALLHEVAHAYHDRFAPGGVHNEIIRRAYQAAVASGIYAHVLNVNGVMHQANAIANAMEYFANTTTAYFLRNDDWPEDRDELARTYPLGFQMIRRLWNV